MRLRLNMLVDLVLALWITLVAAQHLAVVASVLWAGPGGSPPPDLRAGYWGAGSLMVLALAARRLSPAKEVSGDR